MKLTAVLAVALLAGSTKADITLNLGNFDLMPEEVVEIPVPNLTGTLTAWELSYDYLGNNDGSWSGDALFGVLAPGLNGGTGYGVEATGWINSLGPQFEFVGEVGASSSDPGSFNHFFTGWTNDVMGTGTWFMYVSDSWSGGSEPSSYHNVVFTLYGVVPAPGSLALLGLGALAVRRRR